MRSSNGTTNDTSVAANAFRAAEKRFRRCKDSCDKSVLSDVIDFHFPEANSFANRELLQPVKVNEGAPTWLSDARVYSLRGVDGFRFICSPLSPAVQLSWARQALQSWAEPPHETNLSSGTGRETQAENAGLWAAHLRDARKSSLSRLSWSTLGYHYQWTPRCYDQDKRSRIPSELAQLAADLASVGGWRLRAEAAIVNYYNVSSTMGGHRDDAEPYQEVDPCD